MSEENVIKILVRRSLQILREEGISGYFNAIKNYYEAYHPLRKDLYYWLYSKLARNKMVVKDIQGSKMYLNLNDYGLSKHLFLNGVREPECTKIMKKWLKKGMTIVELGANIGYYALMEASIIGDKGKIYAVEPFPSNFELLKNNISLNPYKKIIHPYHLAISNKSGTEKLFVSNEHNLCNMLSSDCNDYVEVKTETLDNFLKGKKSPDLIRMDIEGFEYYVLEGMKKTLKDNKSCKIFIEMHPHQMNEKGLDYKKPLDTLLNLGYKPIYVVKEHGPIKEETFTYNGKIENFHDFLKENKFYPPDSTHGFGLFLEKNDK